MIIRQKSLLAVNAINKFVSIFCLYNIDTLFKFTEVGGFFLFFYFCFLFYCCSPFPLSELERNSSPCLYRILWVL